MTNKNHSDAEGGPAKDNQEAYGGDRQAMSPLVAALVYGGDDALKFFQGICDGITNRRRKIFDEDINENVEYEGSLPNFSDLKVDRFRLESFLYMALRDASLWKHPILNLSSELLDETLHDCADPLYEKLYQGGLHATGIRQGEHRRTDIPKDEWRKLTFGFRGNSAEIDAKTLYEDVVIQHPNFRAMGQSSRPGPKTNIEDAIRNALDKRRGELSSGMSNMDICREILPDVRKAAGKEYKIDYLANKISKHLK